MKKKKYSLSEEIDMIGFGLLFLAMFILLFMGCVGIVFFIESVV